MRRRRKWIYYGWVEKFIILIIFNKESRWSFRVKLGWVDFFIFTNSRRPAYENGRSWAKKPVAFFSRTFGGDLKILQNCWTLSRFVSRKTSARCQFENYSWETLAADRLGWKSMLEKAKSLIEHLQTTVEFSKSFSLVLSHFSE